MKRIITLLASMVICASAFAGYNDDIVDVGDNPIVGWDGVRFDTDGDGESEYIFDDSGLTFLDGGSLVDVEGVGFLDGQTITWNSDDYTLNVPTGLGPVLQSGQEDLVIVYNNTGSTIENGKVVHPVGGATETRPHVEKAIANTHEGFDREVWVTTMDIGPGEEGFVTSLGKVRELNTTAYNEGDNLWISPDTAGELVAIKPSFPDYAVQVGGVAVKDATVGEFFISPKGDQNDTLQNFWNGTFRETINFTVSSNGSVITGSLAPNNGHPDMTMIFSDGFTMLDTSPAATIALTAGTDSNPQMNYVYVPQSTKVLTVSTSDWPATEHIKVATVLLRSAATTQTDGALRNHNWNDHIQSTSNNQGHLSHITERIRQESAKWNSGTEGSVTIVSGSDPDDVYVSVTGGTVYQMHRQTFPAQNMQTGDDIHVVNDFSAPYQTITNLNSETVDANNSSLSNKHFSFVVWGVINRTGETSHIMLNLPTGSYNSSADAIADANNYSVYDIPSDFNGVGFLIARFTFYLSSSGSGTWTLNDTQDLRGFTPNTTAGGGGGGGGSGVSTFLALTDTPSAYTSQANKLVAVNSGETALEFVTAPSADKITEGNTTVEVIDTGSDGRVVWTTEGTEAGRIDSSQNFGVGTVSPSTKLHVLKNEDGASVNLLTLDRTSATPADADSYNVVFNHENDNNQQEDFAQIQLRADDVSDGTEAGSLHVYVSDGVDGSLDYVAGFTKNKVFKVGDVDVTNNGFGNSGESNGSFLTDDCSTLPNGWTTQSSGSGVDPTVDTGRYKFEITNTSSLDYSRILRTLSTTGDRVTVSFDFNNNPWDTRTGSLTSVNYVAVGVVYDISTTKRINILLDKDGVYSSDGTLLGSASLSANTDYLYTIDIDKSGETYDVLVDGVIIADDKSVFSTGTYTEDNIIIQPIVYGSYALTSYIDNIKVGNGLVAAGYQDITNGIASTDNTNPFRGLHVQASGTSKGWIGADGIIEGHDDLFIGSTSTPVLFVDESADTIGVNTASPNEALHVAGSIEIEDNGNNCKLIVDTDGTCDTGTSIGTDTSIALCLSCS